MKAVSDPFWESAVFHASGAIAEDVSRSPIGERWEADQLWQAAHRPRIPEPAC